MKKLALVVTALIFLLLTPVSCGQARDNNSKVEIKNGVVQVLYFHGKQRCATCLAIEEQTKALLDTEFQSQQQQGKIKYRVVDISTPEGEAVADHYEVAFSSLILDKDGQTVDLTDMGFRYARTEPETFKANLKVQINKLLK